jgi:hypothetical protein
MPASACVPACCFSHCLPEYLLLVFPSGAVAEAVLLGLGHSPSTPPAFVIISVAEPLWVDCSGCMPGLRLIETRGQRFFASHRDRSFGSCLALVSVAEVLPALVGHPLRHSCRPSLGDISSPVRGQAVCTLYHCASACLSGQVALMVCFFVSGDAGMSWDPVDISCNAVGVETPHPSCDLPQQSLRCTWLEVCRSSNCGL